jgi:signal transduction histidine kinase
LWLGVERPGFGRELDYVSPWKYFLDHFCEIADSALLRILNEEQEEERNKRMVEFQSMAMTTITTGNALHELSNLALALTTPVIALEVAVRDGKLECSEDIKEIIRSLRGTRSRIQDLLRLFYNAMKRNEHRPCSLDEALAHVCKKVENSWKERGIEIEKPRPSGAIIDVPFHAAIFALDVIFDNAKDAILGQGTDTGRIRIKVQATTEEVVCEITDSGPGVPDEVRKTLLKKVTRSDKLNSNGVGLYLSVFLLRGYGGDITLAPRERWAGATFRIHFRKSSTLRSVGGDEAGRLETDAMLVEAQPNRLPSSL